MNKAQRRAAQLGMPYGTASARLRKNLLFKYVQAVGDDYCFKCSNKIESVDELSIEHKQPWEGRSSELFWDLDNIAFSHLSCNRPHEYNKRKMTNDGMYLCTECGEYKTPECFYENKHTTSGLDSWCKKCQTIRRRRYAKMR